jgi:hypothetical protein
MLLVQFLPCRFYTFEPQRRITDPASELKSCDQNQVRVLGCCRPYGGPEQLLVNARSQAHHWLHALLIAKWAAMYYN